MTTLTSSTPSQAVVAHLGDPVWYADGLFEFLVPTERTGGALSVFRATCPQGFGPPRHVHTREDEVFVVLEGDVVFEVAGTRQLAGPGTAVWMPRGVPHTFRIQSETAVMLGVIAPGDFEGLFRALGVPALERAMPPAGAAPLDLVAVMEEQRARDTEVVGPPLQD